MENNNLPFVSIVIVNYNGKDYLERCVNMILRNNYPAYEVVVVDNNSTDGSIEMVEKNFLKTDTVKLVKLSENYGPARARNEGVKVARGSIVGFLDNDTEVDPDWISAAVNYFKKDNRLGAVQCKLLLLEAKNRIDYTGEYISSLGFLVHRAAYGEEDVGQYDSNAVILAAKSAGMFIRHDVFDKIGGFDEDYFIFVEETDLGWRCWLSGYKIIFAYDSVVFHHYSATKDIVDKDFNNYLVRFHGSKNYILTLFKTLSFTNLILIVPRHVFLWIGLSGFLILNGNPRSGWNILRGIGWNIANYPMNLKKRKAIQKSRTISDKELFEKVYRRKGALSYIKGFISSQKKLITPENQ